MDPFSALTVAMATIQVIDFSSKIVARGREIHKRGSVSTHDDLKSAAARLQELNEALCNGLGANSTAPNLQEDELKLCSIAAEANQVADELIKLLTKLERQGSKSIFTSIRKALSTVASSGEISRMKEKLECLHNDLVLRNLVSLKLNHKLFGARHDARFDSLDGKTKTIAENILQNKNFFTTGIGDLGRNVLTKIDNHDDVAQRRHEETIAAIATLKNWLEEKDANSKAIFQSLPEDLNASGLLDLRQIQTEILDFLWFRGMYARVEDVSSPYGNTFRWIFEGSRSIEGPSSEFPDWLESGGGCYWINGKAGSGKSTLMKYIYYNSQAQELLSQWASGEMLLTAAFFFWNAGSLLQKSHLGLLRSILHDALSKHPELVPIVFPAHCRAISRHRVQMDAPTLLDVRQAFKILMEQEVVQMKVCLFIDGVDEYDGDHLELGKLLASVSSERAKVVVSSRPTPNCVEAFSDWPSLQLQYLTSLDIQAYVNGNLQPHKRIQELSKRDSVAVRNFLDDIITKASGVFLWVVLVTKSLWAGLRNLDQIEDLRKRVDQLPEDIDELYKHMLDRMEPVYRQHASRVLQLIYRNTQSPDPRPMTVLRLLFADENLDSAIDADIGLLEPRETVRKCEELVGRIRGSCCGLVEIRHATQVSQSNSAFPPNKLPGIDIHSSGIETLTAPHDVVAIAWLPLEVSENRVIEGMVSNTDSLLRSIIQSSKSDRYSERLGMDRSGDLDPVLLTTLTQEINFLHKSVVDFLEQPEIWNTLQSTAPYSFNASLSLAGASLRYIKTIPVEPDTNVDSSLVWESLVRGLNDLLLAENSTELVIVDLLEEFDDLMYHHWRAVEGWMPRFGASLDDMKHWAHLVPSDTAINGWSHGGPPYDSMFSLACRFGLKGYVKHFLEKEQSTLAQIALNRIVCDIEVPGKSSTLRVNQLDILGRSLRHGADPNKKFYKGRSPWTMILWRFENHCVLQHDAVEIWVDILQMLVDSGAEPNAPVLDVSTIIDGKDAHVWRSPLYLIREVLASDGKSRARDRRVRRLSDKLQAVLLKKGGKYKEWDLDASMTIREGMI